MSFALQIICLALPCAALPEYSQYEKERAREKERPTIKAIFALLDACKTGTHDACPSEALQTT